MNDPFIKLDNPAWHALTSEHENFAIGEIAAKRYQPDIVAFVGFKEATVASALSLDPWMKQGESFFVIGDLPPLPSGWVLQFELVCLQMVCRLPVEKDLESPLIFPLTATDAPELHALVTLVQPGYYLPDTHRMGNYFGIKDQGRLVAVAGERMRMDGFTELSAIVTHPDFTGRKYARHLITHLVNRNLDNGITPMLHVWQTNERAIGLYERLGFVTRRKISFWLVKKE